MTMIIHGDQCQQDSILVEVNKSYALVILLCLHNDVYHHHSLIMIDSHY